MRRTGVVIAAVLGMVALVVSLVGLAQAQDGGTVRAGTVDGTPVILYSTGTSQPTVVVAHGFSGSAQIMDPLARGLMRAGFAVVTFDFPGHGANAAPLPADIDRRYAASVLESTLADVLAWTVQQPEVDSARLALLGHSMGAGAVVRYVVTDDVVPVGATVTLSLPSAEGIPPGQALVPPNLLLLFGSLEDSRFSDAALQGVQAAYPDAIVGQPYGDAAAGTARQATAIPGVEHIGILFSQATLDATTAWLGPALGVDPAAASIAPVLLWAVLALLAGGLLLVPLSQVTLGSASPQPTPAVRGRSVLVVVVLASLTASIASWALMPLSDRLPLAVGGYVATWFLIAGGVAAGCWLWRWRTPAERPAITVRSVVGALAATALASAVVVLPGTMSWAPFSVVGDRTWLLPVITLAFVAYFAADELLVRRASLPRRLGLALGNRLIAVVVILASIPLLGAPGFLILLLPLMVLFLVVLAGYAAVVSRFRRGYLAAVLVQAVPLSLLVATTFPLVAPA